MEIITDLEPLCIRRAKALIALKKELFGDMVQYPNGYVHKPYIDRYEPTCYGIRHIYQEYEF